MKTKYNLSKTTDAMRNMVSGLNTSKDKSFYNEIFSDRLNDHEAIEIYRGSWLASNVIDVDVFEALREWREFKVESDDDIVETLETAEIKYGIKEKLANALKYAKIFGGSAILMNIENTGDISTPLNISKVQKGSLKWLSVMDKRQLQPVISQDLNYPESPNFMRPEFYKSAYSDAIIHSSRLLLFKGVELPMQEMIEKQYWGDSEFIRVLPAIRAAESIQQSIASLVQKSNVDIWKIKGLAATLARDNKTGACSIRSRLSANNMLASSVNSVAIDKDNEEFERTNIDFGHLDKLQEDALKIVASASGKPVSKILGTHVSGLNNGGESDIRNFYDYIKSYQESSIRPNLVHFDQVLMMSELGYIIDDYDFKFRPLWQPTDKEIAELELLKAQRDQTYLNSGVITNETIAKELLKKETYSSLSNEDIEALGDFGVSDILNKDYDEED